MVTTGTRAMTMGPRVGGPERTHNVKLVRRTQLNSAQCETCSVPDIFTTPLKKNLDEKKYFSTYCLKNNYGIELNWCSFEMLAIEGCFWINLIKWRRCEAVCNTVSWFHELPCHLIGFEFEHFYQPICSWLSLFGWIWISSLLVVLSLDVCWLLGNRG